MITILFAAPRSHWARYETPLKTALSAMGLDYRIGPDMPAAEVDYVIYGPHEGGLTDFSQFPKLKAVQNLWAGVETVVGNPTLQVPLARMVDEEGLTQGMVEYVTGHVLRHHLGMDAHIVNPDQRWAPVAPPLAAERPVTILGMGTLGTACARALRGLGFAVTGWARTEKRVSGVTCLAGPDGLARALRGAQMLVLLLPLTRETDSILNAQSLSLLARGAVVLNPGRGALIDDEALLAALASGQVSHATLDTFRTEPLPEDHPFWSHRNITVTPHVASETRPGSAARVVADNLWRFETGRPMLHLVDRIAGY